MAEDSTEDDLARPSSREHQGGEEPARASSRVRFSGEQQLQAPPQDPASGAMDGHAQHTAQGQQGCNLLGLQPKVRCCAELWMGSVTAPAATHAARHLQQPACVCPSSEMSYKLPPPHPQPTSRLNAMEAEASLWSRDH